MGHWSEGRREFKRVWTVLTEGTIDGEIVGALPTTLEIARAISTLARDFQPATAEEFESELRWVIQAIAVKANGLAPVLDLLHNVAVDLETAVQRRDGVDGLKAAVIASAEGFHSRLLAAVARVATACAERFLDRERVFVYSCSRTVNAAIIQAKNMGKNIEVVVTESRPWYEGLNTVKALDAEGIRVTLGIDAAIAVLISECTSVLVGAESISHTGDVLCKVGTYPLAVLARERGLPVRIAADCSKFDVTSPYLQWPNCGPGGPASDLVGTRQFQHATVVNALAEVVPSYLITEIVTERGVLSPADAARVVKSLPVSISLIKTRVPK